MPAGAVWSAIRPVPGGPVLSDGHRPGSPHAGAAPRDPLQEPCIHVRLEPADRTGAETDRAGKDPSATSLRIILAERPVRASTSGIRRMRRDVPESGSSPADTALPPGNPRPSTPT